MSHKQKLKRYLEKALKFHADYTQHIVEVAQQVERLSATQEVDDGGENPLPPRPPKPPSFIDDDNP
jgi:hypothetical protein